ncbi:retrovirus-related pol polyprotein from transposon 297-like protein [Plakobranchus ocellatus]|uniref:Retrovirus-related pol polyprotein from transposon 297-like protein n=1 Tax=Plakobranchus ocellatus TaxID=259542 RepID=A0AAV3XYZ7_9GAST|nr:retrovirus-related pol polyprotein from transposon 297-like protein [Plakobranchus ocellatus]
MPELKKKLKEMEENGIKEVVDEPTEWVHNLVIAQKLEGSFRLCLDPKALNKNIKSEIFEIPTFEQIVPQLGGKKVFTTLDQKDAYWQVELDKASSRLCTFNTPFGRYCFKRMPFGIPSASEILRKRAYETFGDIVRLHILHDDALIAAETEAECDEILIKVLKRAREHNVKFNLNKIQLRQQEVTYMGRKIRLLKSPGYIRHASTRRQDWSAENTGDAQFPKSFHTKHVHTDRTTKTASKKRSTVSMEPPAREGTTTSKENLECRPSFETL